MHGPGFHGGQLLAVEWRAHNRLLVFDWVCAVVVFFDCDSTQRAHNRCDRSSQACA
jgi:hypothetical protein